jgi:hypothetical protein
MTVVAKGAALFASTISISEKLKRKVGIKPNFSWILNTKQQQFETEEIVT